MEMFIIIGRINTALTNKGEPADYLDLDRNLTPSPSAIAIICDRPVLPRMEIAFRSREMGMPVSSDSSGGSVIS